MAVAHPRSRAVLRAFPSQYAERGALVEAEERDARLDTPIFVCQLSFPAMPTVLHFFEPRSVTRLDVMHAHARLRGRSTTVTLTDTD